MMTITQMYMMKMQTMMMMLWHAQAQARAHITSRARADQASLWAPINTGPAIIDEVDDENDGRNYDAIPLKESNTVP